MCNKILIVDDEPDVLYMLGRNLERAGFSVITAETGEDALSILRQEHPVLVVLDLMLPGISGLEICKILKDNPDTADIEVIMLTARQEEMDRIAGFEIGADDYVTKPFSPREMVLRIKARLKRRNVDQRERRVRVVGRIELDLELCQARVDGTFVDLTPIEFKLLNTLAERPWQVHSREKLLRDIWGYECAIETRTVDAHMRRLRDKLENAASLIVTVRGFGYRIAQDDETSLRPTKPEA